MQPREKSPTSTAFAKEEGNGCDRGKDTKPMNIGAANTRVPQKDMEQEQIAAGVSGTQTDACLLWLSTWKATVSDVEGSGKAVRNWTSKTLRTSS